MTSWSIHHSLTLISMYPPWQLFPFWKPARVELSLIYSAGLPGILDEKKKARSLFELLSILREMSWNVGGIIMRALEDQRFSEAFIRYTNIKTLPLSRWDSKLLLKLANWLLENESWKKYFWEVYRGLVDYLFS